MTPERIKELRARRPFTAAVGKGCTLICLTLAERDELLDALERAEKVCVAASESHGGKLSGSCHICIVLAEWEAHRGS
jgi:hypothetical protein